MTDNQTSHTELKPCPFCGAEASAGSYETLRSDKHSLWGAGCTNFDECCADAPQAEGHPTRKAAIKAWNTRHEQ